MGDFMVKLYSDLIKPDTPPAFVTKFQILTEDRLPFDYWIDKTGLCETYSDIHGIETADERRYIHILERDIPENCNRFSGGAEPILNGTLKFVQPSRDSNGIAGADLDILEFGDWKCMRCHHVTRVPITKGKIMMPFECESDVCGRKGPFKEQFSLDLVKPIWKLPLPPIESSAEEIYLDIYNELKQYLILKEEEYCIIALWIMASWLVDDFSTCPYLCMIAPKSSGKTAVLNVLGELAYRSVSAISVTAASLFRAIEMWHITLLIDEAEYQIRSETEAGQALYGCLNGGYKRGSYALRIEGDGSSSTRVPAAYDVFGFKAIAATKLFHPTLESRSIIINMVQGMPQKIIIEPGKMALIRAKLLFWRFETLGKLPIVFPNSKIGRLIEMFIPLFTVAQLFKKKVGRQNKVKFEEINKILIDKIKEMEIDRKEEEQGSEDAMVISAIYDLSENERISTKEIATHLKWIDEYTDSKEAAKSYWKIGKVLKILGIRTKHTKQGNIIEHLEEPTHSVLAKLYKRFLTIASPSPDSEKDPEVKLC